MLMEVHFITVLVHVLVPKYLNSHVHNSFPILILKSSWAKEQSRQHFHNLQVNIQQGPFPSQIIIIMASAQSLWIHLLVAFFVFCRLPVEGHFIDLFLLGAFSFSPNESFLLYRHCLDIYPHNTTTMHH